jgi:hypothetical protein
MENIKIVDDFLNKDDLQLLTSIISSKKWEYGHASDGREMVNTPFWSMDLKQETFFDEYIKDKIESYFSTKFQVNRVYANGQTYGQNGSYHIDDTSENTFTFCLYTHNIKNTGIETAGGHLYIKVPNEKIISAIEPYCNRGVLFPSNYYHKGCAFNRYITSMRICIAWKLQKIV